MQQEETIYEDAWRYRIAYFFTKKKPQMTTSCVIFWRCVLLIIPVYLVNTIAIVVFFIAAPLFAHYLVYNRKDGIRVKRMEHWPEFRHMRIFPITVLAIAVTLYILTIVGLAVYQGASAFIHKYSNELLIGTDVLLGLVLLWVAYAFISKSDAWAMFVEHIEDWKARRCRIVVVKKRVQN